MLSQRKTGDSERRKGVVIQSALEKRMREHACRGPAVVSEEKSRTSGGAHTTSHSDPHHNAKAYSRRSTATPPVSSFLVAPARSPVDTKWRSTLSPLERAVAEWEDTDSSFSSLPDGQEEEETFFPLTPSKSPNARPTAEEEVVRRGDSPLWPTRVPLRSGSRTTLDANEGIPPPHHHRRDRSPLPSPSCRPPPPPLSLGSVTPFSHSRAASFSCSPSCAREAADCRSAARGEEEEVVVVATTCPKPHRVASPLAVPTSNEPRPNEKEKEEEAAKRAHSPLPVHESVGRWEERTGETLPQKADQRWKASSLSREEQRQRSASVGAHRHDRGMDGKGRRTVRAHENGREATGWRGEGTEKRNPHETKAAYPLGQSQCPPLEVALRHQTDVIRKKMHRIAVLEREVKQWHDTWKPEWQEKLPQRILEHQRTLQRIGMKLLQEWKAQGQACREGEGAALERSSADHHRLQRDVRTAASRPSAPRAVSRRATPPVPPFSSGDVESGGPPSSSHWLVFEPVTPSSSSSCTATMQRLASGNAQLVQLFQQLGQVSRRVMDHYAQTTTHLLDAHHTAVDRWRRKERQWRAAFEHVRRAYDNEVRRRTEEEAAQQERMDAADREKEAHVLLCHQLQEEIQQLQSCVAKSGHQTTKDEVKTSCEGTRGEADDPIVSSSSPHRTFSNAWRTEALVERQRRRMEEGDPPSPAPRSDGAAPSSSASSAYWVAQQAHFQHDLLHDTPNALLWPSSSFSEVGETREWAGGAPSTVAPRGGEGEGEAFPHDTPSRGRRWKEGGGLLHRIGKEEEEEEKRFLEEILQQTSSVPWRRGTTGRCEEAEAEASRSRRLSLHTLRQNALQAVCQVVRERQWMREERDALVGVLREGQDGRPAGMGEDGRADACPSLSFSSSKGGEMGEGAPQGSREEGKGVVVAPLGKAAAAPSLGLAWTSFLPDPSRGSGKRRLTSCKTAVGLSTVPATPLKDAEGGGTEEGPAPRTRWVWKTRTDHGAENVCAKREGGAEGKASASSRPSAMAVPYAATVSLLASAAGDSDPPAAPRPASPFSARVGTAPARKATAWTRRTTPTMAVPPPGASGTAPVSPAASPAWDGSDGMGRWRGKSPTPLWRGSHSAGKRRVHLGRTPPKGLVPRVAYGVEQSTPSNTKRGGVEERHQTERRRSDSFSDAGEQCGWAGGEEAVTPQREEGSVNDPPHRIPWPTAWTSSSPSSSPKEEVDAAQWLERDGEVSLRTPDADRFPSSALPKARSAATPHTSPNGWNRHRLSPCDSSTASGATQGWRLTALQHRKASPPQSAAAAFRGGNERTGGIEESVTVDGESVQAPRLPSLR